MPSTRRTDCCPGPAANLPFVCRMGPWEHPSQRDRGRINGEHAFEGFSPGLA